MMLMSTGAEGTQPVSDDATTAIERIRRKTATARGDSLRSLRPMEAAKPRCFAYDVAIHRFQQIFTSRSGR